MSYIQLTVKIRHEQEEENSFLSQTSNLDTEAWDMITFIAFF